MLTDWPYARAGELPTEKPVVGNTIFGRARMTGSSSAATDGTLAGIEAPEPTSAAMERSCVVSSIISGASSQNDSSPC